MICVSIGRSRHKHMIAEHRHLVEQGAKLVELRLDYISTRVNIQRLLKDRPCAPSSPSAENRTAASSPAAKRRG